MKPNIDLSVATVRRLCRGDPANLPRLWVHDDAVWPWGQVQLDSTGRLHLRRHDLVTVVAEAVPVLPGLWVRGDVQEFRIDLGPEHLDGGASSRHATTRETRRVLVAAPDRCPECRGYMEEIRTPVEAFSVCTICGYGNRNLTHPVGAGPVQARAV